jgi:hypothetical protein
MFVICCARCGDEIAHTTNEDVVNTVKDSIYCEDCKEEIEPVENDDELEEEEEEVKEN